MTLLTERLRVLVVSPSLTRQHKRVMAVLDFLGKELSYVLLVTVFGSIFFAASEFALAAFLGIFLNSIFSQTDSSAFLAIFKEVEITTTVLCAMLLFCAALRSVAQFIVNLSASYCVSFAQERMRSILAAHMLFNDRPMPHKKIHTMLSEIFPNISSFAQGSASGLACTLRLIVIAAAMVFIAWQEAMLALGLSVLVGLIILFINKKVRSIAGELPSMQENLVAKFEQVSFNWYLLYIAGTFSKEYRHLIHGQRSIRRAFNRTHLLGKFAAALSPFLGIVILISIVGFSQATGNISNVVLMSFLYLYVRFVQNLSGVANAFAVLNANLVFFKKTFSFYLESKPSIQRALRVSSLGENHSKEEESRSEVAQPSEEPEAATVKLTGVHFKYPEAKTSVFDNFDFTAEQGEQVAIVGPSGVGKSTLLAIVTGAEKPQRGSAQINGTEARTAIQSGNLRAAYVGPEPFLFEGSLRENLLYGNNHPVPDSEILEVLRSLAIFRDKPNEEATLLDSEVSHVGSNFSTGQRQRLSFARAILARPNLLVLDEVTANLDTEAKNRVIQWLERLKQRCTVLIVTHNRELLKHADKVYELGKCEKP